MEQGHELWQKYRPWFEPFDRLRPASKLPSWARTTIFAIRGAANAALLTFGFLARCALILSAAYLLYAITRVTDWSAYHMRLADLNLANLLEAFVKGALCIAFWSGLVKWAFFSGRKNYRAWAKLSFFALCIIGWAYATFLQRR